MDEKLDQILLLLTEIKQEMTEVNDGVQEMKERLDLIEKNRQYNQESFLN